MELVVAQAVARWRPAAYAVTVTGAHAGPRPHRYQIRVRGSGFSTASREPAGMTDLNPPPAETADCPRRLAAAPRAPVPGSRSWRPSSPSSAGAAGTPSPRPPPLPRRLPLRHGAATLALAGGTDLKVVQDQLGHSTITVTADTYTSVLPETARAAVERTAALLFPARCPATGGKSASLRVRKRPLPAWARSGRRNQNRAV